ncbi:MAG: TetR/AcrR family transcriptional regulator [Microthrixaceae bacterium]
MSVLRTVKPTQQARSQQTRERLLDTVVACITECGYAATTTAEVLERARVSRGAMLHHFPTRATLMAAALERLLWLRLDAARRAIEQVDGPLGIDEGVDLLWSLHDSALFIAHVEMWVAARTDPELAARVTDVDRRFTEETRVVYLEHLAALQPDTDPRAAEMIRDMVFAVMQAVAFQRLVPRGQRPASDYLTELKSWVKWSISGKSS